MTFVCNATKYFRFEQDRGRNRSIVFRRGASRQNYSRCHRPTQAPLISPVLAAIAMGDRRLDCWELDHEGASCSSNSKFEALARSNKIREVGTRVISGVRRCGHFGLWLSLVERLVRNNNRMILSNYPDLI
jgi:hypothetical protein